MSVTVAAIPLPLQVTTRSTPPIAPFDLNTGDWPAIFKGSNTAFQIGVFDASGFPVDLSNLASLKLDIFNYTPPQDYLGYPFYQCEGNIIDGDLIIPGLSSPDSPIPLVTVSVAAANITATIPTARWQAGLARNATALVSSADMGNINLQGKPFNRFIVCVSGVLPSNGGRIIYGSGPIFVYESGITVSF